LALTGCGGGGGGGGDDDPKFPNPTIEVAVDGSGSEVTIKVTSMNGGAFGNELKFNDREPFVAKANYIAMYFDEQLQFKCYVETLQGPDPVGHIRCDVTSYINGQWETISRSHNTYDGDYNGVQAWVNVPETGTNELKYIVTDVDNPITYVIPLEVEGGVLKFGAYTTR
jgi:hypothetical protein